MEKEIIIKVESEENKNNDLECLLCSIMEALGRPKNMFKDYKASRIQDILGGNSEIIISMGGPDKVYEEDSMLDMFKDIINLVESNKTYSTEDIKKIRENKKSHGASLKKLLAVMDDEHILKAFNGMQIFKNGGSVDLKKVEEKPVDDRVVTIREAISGEEVSFERLDKDLASGHKIIHTIKGDGYLINGKFYFQKNMPEPNGPKSNPTISKKAEGGQVSSLSTVKAKIGEEEYTLFEAKTEEEKRKGLLGILTLDKNEGMIFYYNKPQELSYWNKDVEIPIDIIFFNDNFECIKIYTVLPLNEDYITCENAQYVVELNANSNVKIGDELDLPEDDDEYVMKVLGSDGEPLMLLKGGERIFSRANTYILIKLAKRAYRSKADKDYKRLGKSIFKYLDILDNREPEYVTKS